MKRYDSCNSYSRQPRIFSTQYSPVFSLAWATSTLFNHKLHVFECLVTMHEHDNKLARRTWQERIDFKFHSFRMNALSFLLNKWTSGPSPHLGTLDLTSQHTAKKHIKCFSCTHHLWEIVNLLGNDSLSIIEEADCDVIVPAS